MATPAMFPSPTVAESALVRAWKCEISPRIVRIVVASPDDVDGVAEPLHGDPSEEEGIIDAAQKQHNDDERNSGAEGREEDRGQQFDGVSEEPVQVGEVALYPAVTRLGGGGILRKCHDW